MLIVDGGGAWFRGYSFTCGLGRQMSCIQDTYWAKLSFGLRTLYIFRGDMQVSDHFQQSLLLMKSLFFSDHDLADVSAKSVYHIHLFNLFSGRFDGFCRYGHPDVVCPLVNFSCSRWWRFWIREWWRHTRSRMGLNRVLMIGYLWQ